MAKRATPEFSQYCFDFPRFDAMRSRHGPRWLDNLYFGLKPSTGEAKAMADGALSWSGMLSSGYTQTSPQCLHVSLVSCDKHASLPEAFVAQLHDRMNGFKGAPVDIHFDRLGSFGRNSIALYNNATNDAFQALRCSLLARTTELPRIRRINPKTASPHMTVFHGDLRDPARQVETLAWRCREVLLIYSHNGAGRHTIVGRWPLTAGRFEAGPEATSGKPDWDLFD